jgi:quercetin dioxygenase-like cupin family protein
MSRTVSTVDTALTRRALVESLAGLFLLASPASAQKAADRAGPIFQHDLPDVMLKDWSVTAVEVSYAPGQASAAHRHPGITIAYVLEGEIRSKIGDGPEQSYTVGQMFLETPGELHAVSRNASSTQPARLLAVLLAPKGQPLTTPEKG